MKNILFVVITAGTISLGTPNSAVAKPTVFPAQGGRGDRTATAVCPNGQYLVGFDGRVGA